MVLTRLTPPLLVLVILNSIERYCVPGIETIDYWPIPTWYWLGWPVPTWYWLGWPIPTWYWLGWPVPTWYWLGLPVPTWYGLGWPFPTWYGLGWPVPIWYWLGWPVPIWYWLGWPVPTWYWLGWPVPTWCWLGWLVPPSGWRAGRRDSGYQHLLRQQSLGHSKQMWCHYIQGTVLTFSRTGNITGSDVSRVCNKTRKWRQQSLGHRTRRANLLNVWNY